MVPAAHRIAGLNSNFILPPSLAVHEECGAVWRLKLIGFWANSNDLSSEHAPRFERSTRLVLPADTIRLLTSACNGCVTALQNFTERKKVKWHGPPRRAT